tara:strand:+ start:1452 stop:3614 length:2163 start_codon:yes stop_codon:yes gene_type:complete
MEYTNTKGLDESEEVSEQEDELELQSIIKSEMDSAKDFIEQIGQERDEATRYYLGKEPSATSELQSEFISTDVRDSILFMLPSIMRTFFGTKKVVEFVPHSAEDIPIAKQQTDYINYIIQEKNPGFHVLYSAFKDALVRKTGFIKAYWDDSITSTCHEFSNLSPEAYTALLMDDDVEIMDESMTMESTSIMDEMTGEEYTQEVPVSYDLKIRRVKAKDQVVIEAIPPEEVLISRSARDLHTAPYVAHRMVKTVSELVAMGYDKDDMEQYTGGGTDIDTAEWEAEQARNPLGNMSYPDRPDPAGQDVLYVEHYLFYDLDDDGIDERIRVCTVGNGMNIVNSMAWDDLPITIFSPDPEPHTVIGSCPADYLIPIQAAKSQIMRDTMDSLGQSIFPRMGIVEGQVNIDDVLNTDIGQPIRMRAPNMVQPFAVPFVGKEAFPVLGYLDEAKENRTGVSKAAAGLNADALQSSTKAAVSATMSASQGRIEMICRHFAEGGLKDLFNLVNNLVIKNQEKEDVFRLNNEFIEVDPRYWDANKDIVVNVAISKGSDEEKMQVLAQMSSKQEQILQTLGPQNPMVSLQQYANTLARIIEMAGFKDTSSFINTDIPPMPQQQEQQKQDPAELLAMAEIQKAEAETQKVMVQAQRDMVDAETDRMKIIMDDDFKRDEAEADIRVKAAELQAKYGAQVNVAEINALMERDRETIRQVAKTQAQGLFNGSGVG